MIEAIHVLAHYKAVLQDGRYGGKPPSRGCYLTAAEVETRLWEFLDDPETLGIDITVNNPTHPDYLFVKIRLGPFFAPYIDKWRVHWPRLTKLLGSDAIELALAAKFA